MKNWKKWAVPAGVTLLVVVLVAQYAKRSPSSPGASFINQWL